MESLFKNPHGSLTEKHPSTLKLKGWKDTLYHLQQSMPVHTEQCGRRTAWPSSHQLTGSLHAGWVWLRGAPGPPLLLCVHVICISRGWMDGGMNIHRGWMEEWTFIMDGWRGGHPSHMEGWLFILEGGILTGTDSKGHIGHTKQGITYLLPCQRHPISIGVGGCEVPIAFKILELLRMCLDHRKPTTQVDNMYPRHFSSGSPSLLSYYLFAGKIWGCERKRADKWQWQTETEGRNEWHDNVFCVMP